VKQALCLAGPTASGKTAAALAIAQALAARGQQAEIISVDSALVYRGMNIGTAKPTREERALVPHHLIDIVEPTQAYSAAQFVAHAQALIADIQARHHVPLLVGGTMLYFKALLQGLDDMPAANAAVRAALNAQATEWGWPALHAQLAQADPATAARLAPADAQRIQRALEVYRISGRPLSSFHQDRSSLLQNAPPLISLEPVDRGWLHQRIAERFEAMLAAGFLDEVRNLRAGGQLSAEMPSMRCVGYRQAWQALEAASEEPMSLQLQPWTDQAVAATRQLAKRQLTWLRSMPWRHVVACDAPNATAQVVQRALQLWQAADSLHLNPTTL
jgi:tRNA dimethylallyltransferase